MGCDIHLYAEGRDKKTGEWLPLRLGDYVSRDYYFFALLAGVRNYYDVVPVAADRGVPEDITPVVRRELETWEDDAHSTSWCTLDEMSTTILKRVPHLDPWHGYKIGGGLVDLCCSNDRKQIYEERPVYVDEIRFIFWFDN